MISLSAPGDEGESFAAKSAGLIAVHLYLAFAYGRSPSVKVSQSAERRPREGGRANRRSKSQAGEVKDQDIKRSGGWARRAGIGRGVRLTLGKPDAKILREGKCEARKFPVALMFNALGMRRFFCRRGFVLDESKFDLVRPS
jgi:hypothetical protein